MHFQEKKHFKKQSLPHSQTLLLPCQPQQILACSQTI